MKTVSQTQFYSFIAEKCSMSARMEPRQERTADYLYECFDDAEGNEVAVISYRHRMGKTEIEYTIND